MTHDNNFRKHIREALRRINDVKQLGKTELASSRYIGNHLGAQFDNQHVTVIKRGEVLQQILLTALKKLKSQDVNAAELLEFQYVQEKSPPEGARLWNVSQAAFYTLTRNAAALFGDVFITCLDPAIRLESPMRVTSKFFISDTIQALSSVCLNVLNQDKTVAIKGEEGVGKTTIAAYLVSKFSNKPIFWLTIHPGLNDQFMSVLYAVGYFLHHNGASNLWLELSKETPVNPGLALSTVRNAIEQLRDAQALPIFCFDQLELLQVDQFWDHQQIVNFINGLRGLCPIILVGNQIPAQADLPRELKAMDHDDVTQILKNASIELPADPLTALCRHIRGNLRMLELFIALHSPDDSLETILQQLDNTESETFTLPLEVIFDRNVQRLDETAKKILWGLSVYRQPISQRILADESNIEALERLLSLNLLQKDTANRVSMHPTYAEIILKKLSRKERDKLHILAGQRREEFKEYTEAAYHFICADEAAQAISLWKEHQQHEINLGQAATALTLFRNVSCKHLNEDTEHKLHLILAGLLMLAGDYQSAEATITTSPKDRLLMLDTQELKGQISILKGDLDAAAAAYRLELQIANEFIIASRIAKIYKNLSWISLQQQALDRAWLEALFARYEVENVQGLVQSAKGEYREAEQYYRAALNTLAAVEKIIQTDPAESKAKTYTNLAEILIKQHQLDEAMPYLQKASERYRKIGKYHAMAGIKVNLAQGYIFNRNYTAAITLASDALTQSKAVHYVKGITLANQALAEAYLGKKDLSNSERFAKAVVDIGEKAVVPDGLRVLAEVRLQQGRFEEARILANESVTLARQNKDLYLEAYAWRVLMQIYQGLEEMDKADTAYTDARRIFEQLDLQIEIERLEHFRKSDDNNQ